MILWSAAPSKKYSGGLPLSLIRISMTPKPKLCVWLIGQQLLGSNPVGVAFDFNKISNDEEG
jgi:hypothetical protein